jgi:hypothetical protein
MTPLMSKIQLLKNEIFHLYGTRNARICPFDIFRGYPALLQQGGVLKRNCYYEPETISNS